MQKTSIQTIMFIGLLSACKAADPTGSSLAFFDGEEGFVADACAVAKGTAIARVSVINVGNRQLSIVHGDYCNARRNTSERAKQEKSGFSLQGSARGSAAATARKPVYIHYGYMGNAEGDKLIHQGRTDIMPWANENFRVVDVSGMDISKAQQTIIADRKANPADYGKNSYVMVDIDSHGYTDQNGVHRIVKGDQAANTSTQTSYRTTDVTSALLEGVGHNAGNVVCTIQSCQSGAVKDDPAFAKQTQSAVNPQQQRAFVFSAAGDKLAHTGGDSGIEQTMRLLTQSGDPQKGLTVQQFQEKLDSANLGTPHISMQTYVYPVDGASTDMPLPGVGGLSHFGSRFDYESQGPSIVGASNAVLLPPGVGANTNSAPVNSYDDHANDYLNNLPPNTVDETNWADPNAGAGDGGGSDAAVP